MLKADQREFYHEQGYLILRDFFSPALLAQAADEADALLQRRDLIAVENLRCRWQINIHSGAREFETFDPILDLSPACARIAADARLLAVLAALYGEEACLFKDKLIFKWPGAKGYGLHQDWIAWPGFPRSFLTVLVAFDRADAGNGCTQVFPGYHKKGLLSPEDGHYHELPLESVDEAHGVNLELERGDVAVFGGFTPHRSAPNHSPRWRRQLFLSYNKSSDGGPQRDKHYQEFHCWMRAKYPESDRKNLYFR